MIKNFLLISSISFFMFSFQKDGINGVSKVSSNEEEKIVESIGTTKELNAFIPKNFSILDSLACDLNQDGRNDYILLLKHNDEEQRSDALEHPEKRPMYLLIRNEKNQLELKYKNDNVVLCVDCGGVMGDPYQSIVFKNGYFSIENHGGSNWRWIQRITFKYSKEKNDWFLHKIGVDSYHTSDPEKVESEVKTTKDFGQVRFVDYDGYKE